MFRILITLAANNDLGDKFGFSPFCYSIFSVCIVFLLLKAKTCNSIFLKQQVPGYVLFLCELLLITSPCRRWFSTM